MLLGFAQARDDNAETAPRLAYRIPIPSAYTIVVPCRNYMVVQQVVTAAVMLGPVLKLGVLHNPNPRFAHRA